MRIAAPHMLLATCLVWTACKSEIDNKPAAALKEGRKDATPKPADATAAKPTSLKVDATASKVGFVGAKVTDDHEGAFASFDGTITMAGDKPSAVAFTIKTDSLEIEPGDLGKHLRSPDFFDVEKFPEASFKSSTITAKPAAGASHEVVGDLTLHGVTKTVSFPANVVVTAGQAKGTAEFTINRKDFGIVYPGMSDDLIKDDVLLKIDLVAPRGSAG